MQPSQKMLKQISTYLMFDTLVDQNQSGTIYKAKEQNTNESCLIKVITKERLKQDSSFHERIRQEEKKLHDIKNPRILHFHSLIETPNYYYFISEGSDEGTLENHIAKKGPMSEEEILNILLMILQGYAEYYRRNIPYNNISSKALFKFGNEYKLSLFFLPDYYEKIETSFKNSKPPSYYSSPESLEGVPSNSKKDIWALGILLYELSFGKVPFSGDNIIALSRNIEKNWSEIYKNIEKSQKISPELKFLMKRMIDIESKRLTWVEIIESQLLVSLKKTLETALIQNYETVSTEIKAGKINFKANTDMTKINPLPNIKTSNSSGSISILKKEVLDTLECLDHSYGFKAKMLQTLENILFIWGQKLKFLESPKTLISPQKKSLTSPTKKITPLKKKQEAPYEKWAEEDSFLFEEDINVILPVSSLYMQKTDKIFNKEEKKQEKEAAARERKPSLHKRTDSDSSNEENSKATLQIMKPGVYPQITPHDKISEKARMQYLKSLRMKKETLKPILEMSIEESSALDTLTISIVKNNFQDAMKEFFYRYLHENEILEFLYNAHKELIKVKSITDHEFQSYCLMKLIMMRFCSLCANIQNKNNVFSLDFWKEIVNLDMYKTVNECVRKNQKKYEENYEKAYQRGKNSNLTLTNEQSKFLSSDLNVPHSEFNKSFNESILILLKKLFEEGKSLEKKDKEAAIHIYELIYKLMFCQEISKNLSFIKLDVDLEFDIVEFQDRMARFTPDILIEQVEIYKNKFIGGNK